MNGLLKRCYEKLTRVRDFFVKHSQLFPINSSAQAAFAIITAEVERLDQAAGGKVAPQLWHQGMMRKPGTGPTSGLPSGENVKAPLTQRAMPTSSSTG